MRGFGDTPPGEILEAVRDRGDADVVEAVRDALIGRAWRVAGSVGEGQCDYPLCPHRQLAERPALVAVALQARGASHPIARLKICRYDFAGVNANDDDGDGECHAWAIWVKRRHYNGRLDVKR